MTIAAFVAGLLVLAFGFVVAFGAPYVPSLRREVRSAFGKLRPLSNKDVLVDLGSGDGIVLKEAAKYGVKLYGYELNPILVLISRFRLKGRATISLANMWSVKLPNDVTVVYAFIVKRDTEKLDKLLQTEANRINREFDVITYGDGLTNRTPLAELRGHKTYRITPLHQAEA